MNIKELHTQEKPVSATSLFKSELGNATAIKILKGEKLKEHITKTPALLLCPGCFLYIMILKLFYVFSDTPCIPALRSVSL